MKPASVAAARRRSRGGSSRPPAVSLPDVEALDEPRRSVSVAEQLKSLIVSGQLQPGDRLPTEGELAAHFGLSRITIREALQMLRALGLIDATRGRGTFVSRPDAQAPMLDLAYFAFETEAAVDDLFEVRTLLETRAVSRAAQRVPDAERTGLTPLVERMRPLTLNERSDPTELAELDTEFHLRIAQIGGNLVLEQLMRRLMQVLEIVRTRSLAVSGQRARSWDQHMRIAEAVERGDAELAVARIVEHMDSVRRAALAQDVRRR